MPQNKKPNRYAIVSVTDKTNLHALAQGLINMGFQIISSGGTAKALQAEDLPCIEVEKFTGFPEMLGGRVKTLHPKIHGGILYDRSSEEHQDQIDLHGISPIEVVAVNLYNFSIAVEERLSLSDAINFIDIGGPTMLRAAAKNFKYCLPIIDPEDYDEVLNQLQQDQIDDAFRKKLAQKVFKQISEYDRKIAQFFASQASDDNTELPNAETLSLSQVQALRYGENPHQKAGLYTEENKIPFGFASTQQHQGKELSYNNFLDANAAVGISEDLRPAKACVIVKHTNPCGVSTGDIPGELLFKKALGCDSKSAFGGIVSCNFEVDEDLAISLAELFLECVVAPSFAPQALATLRKKKNLRLISGSFTPPKETRKILTSIRGGYLLQTEDNAITEPKNWQATNDITCTQQELGELKFALTVAKHVKSNAIVLVKDGHTVGIGAGQMSRIDACELALKKADQAGFDLNGSFAASDAFFPFRDCLDMLAKKGVRAIVQPGGSIRDDESIAAARDHNIAMYLTGTRHFKH